MEKWLTVGQLAQIAGVSVRTLQYYDRLGLLPPGKRTNGGWRLYEPGSLLRLQQIQVLKYMGLPLKTIRERLTDAYEGEDIRAFVMAQLPAVYYENMRLEAILAAVGEEPAGLHTENVGGVMETMERLAELYQIVALYSSGLQNAVLKRYREDPAGFLQTQQDYAALVEEALTLVEEGEPPEGEKSMELARRWWALVMRFVGGDLGLVGQLIEFNTAKGSWAPGMREKQARVDGYIGAILPLFLEAEGISLGFE